MKESLVSAVRMFKIKGRFERVFVEAQAAIISLLTFPLIQYDRCEVPSVHGG